MWRPLHKCFLQSIIHFFKGGEEEEQRPLRVDRLEISILWEGFLHSSQLEILRLITVWTAKVWEFGTWCPGVGSIYLSIQVWARQGCCYYRIYISSYTTHCGAQIDQITRELQLLQIYHTSQWQRHGARHSHASSHNFHIVAGNILTFVFVLRSYQSYVSSVWHWRSRINYCLLIISILLKQCPVSKVKTYIDCHYVEFAMKSNF